ncbi:hypothetical protein TNCV_1780721 [Trichonephila clavipes]|nr:hypothetical protein TNCV_1780721 [Trichonephila clavipes]
MFETLWGWQLQLATSSENHPGKENSIVEPVRSIATITDKLPYFKYGITLRGLYSSQHMQIFPSSAYSSDMSPIEHEWDLVGRHLARDPRPAGSKDELLLRIQATWNSFPQLNIQNLLDFMSRRIAALIAARDGYTKY